MRPLAAFAFLSLAALAFSGCLSDSEPLQQNASGVPAEPSFEDILPADPQGFEYRARLRTADGHSIDRGAGIMEHGDLIVGTGLNTGWWLADVSDPENPVVLFSDAEHTPYSRDADVIDHGDGRLTAVLATQNDGIHLWDISDPTAPVFASWVDVRLSHNLAVGPGTAYIWSSTHRGPDRQNEVIDASDPYHPVKLGLMGSHGCHHHIFHGTPGEEGSLMGCAAQTRTELWDASGFDPAVGEDADFGMTLLSTVEGGSTDSPVMGSILFSRGPVFEWHHSVFFDHAANTMIVGSETNGGSSPGGCIFHDPVTGESVPTGGLWFYDITDTSDPVLLSWLAPGIPDDALEHGALEGYDPEAYLKGGGAGCNSHFGDLIPGMDRMVIGWNLAGTLLIDFADPANPLILDQFLAHRVDYGSDTQATWDAREVNGYVFTGDGARGMDILRLV